MMPRCPSFKVVAAAFALVRAAMPFFLFSAEPAFAQRGYYLTFMRMPTYGIEAWKSIVDDVHDDGGNLLILWIAGAFRSEKYPITWKYNADHENVKSEFLNVLIDYAHSKKIRIILGFTPFGYDGVNQYALENPDLRATGPDGKPVASFGIGCWGYNLCPSMPESQVFMREYLLEMLGRYSKADGLLVESSDYAICHCSNCGRQYFKQEFKFVKIISEECWTKNPEVQIYLYPHYFSGAKVPGFGVDAAKLPFDPRWGLFFTPHSALPDAELIKRAHRSIFWDDSPALRQPQDIKAAASRAREIGVTGYVPSLETFSFISTHGEENSPWTKNRRQIPLGMGWLAHGQSPYRELPLMLQRMAYREFSNNPDLTLDEYKTKVGKAILGQQSTANDIADLFDLQNIFAYKRTWCQPSPAVSHDRYKAMKAGNSLDADTERQIREFHLRLQAILKNTNNKNGTGYNKMASICRWVLTQWDKSAE